MTLSRRQAITLFSAAPLLPLASPAAAGTQLLWSVRDTFGALQAGKARLLDIRSRGEWRQTGVARGAWPVSLHDRGFSERLFAARDLAGDLPVALICATGGRTASVMQALSKGGYTGFVDVAEGMFGSPAGPGWIAAGLPVDSADVALAGLPKALA